MMTRILYSLLFYLATPFILLRLFWRGRKQPGYRQAWRERFAFYRSPLSRPSSSPASSYLIWLHAVSVGETRAAAPLIDALLERYPDCRLLLTVTTPTGLLAGQEMYQHEPRVLQSWLPYDLPGATRRFLDHFQPTLGLLMETEIWPNLLAAAAHRKLPVALVNARLSRRSARLYARIAPLIRPALARLAVTAAQTRGDAARLKCLGAQHVWVCGNLKFDVLPNPALIALGAGWKNAVHRPVWLAASTREGEEAILLGLLLALQKAWGTSDKPESDKADDHRNPYPNPRPNPLPLLVLVPRHPQRFDDVARLMEQQGVNFCRRSQGLPTAETDVWLGDSMGEMPAYYRLADCAFIGGSLLPFGGQNLIEAAACDCPTLIGQYTYNFAQASRDAISSGAAGRVSNAQELGDSLAALLAAPNRLDAMRQAARLFAAQYRGATGRILEMLDALQ